MTLTNICGIAQGQTVSIVANGPSAADLDPDAVGVLPGISIGIHAAWKLGTFDFLLFVDGTPCRDWIDGGFRDVWNEAIVNVDALREEDLSRVPRDMIIPWRNQFRGGYRYPVRGMETREFVETGTFPGAKLKVTKRRPLMGGVMMTHMTSTICALHAAVIMQPERIVLYGVDCGGPQDRFDNNEPLGRERLWAMRDHRKQLEDFAREWRDTIELANASPYYHEEVSAWAAM